MAVASGKWERALDVVGSARLQDQVRLGIEESKTWATIAEARQKDSQTVDEIV